MFDQVQIQCKLYYLNWNHEMYLIIHEIACEINMPKLYEIILFWQFRNELGLKCPWHYNTVIFTFRLLLHYMLDGIYQYIPIILWDEMNSNFIIYLPISTWPKWQWNKDPEFTLNALRQTLRSCHTISNNNIIMKIIKNLLV